MDVGRASGFESAPRVGAGEGRALVTWFARDRVNAVVVDGAGEVRGRFEAPVEARVEGPTPLRRGDGWALFWNDGYRVRMQPLDGDARALGESKVIARGGTFDVAARGEAVHLVVWRARRRGSVVLTHHELDWMGRERRATVVRQSDWAWAVRLTQHGTLGLAESRYWRGVERRCVGGLRGARRCEDGTSVWFDLAAAPQGWLYLDENRQPRGVRSRLVGKERPAVSLDRDGRQPRLARAGENLYAAVWAREGSLRVALLDGAGRIRHQGDLRP